MGKDKGPKNNFTLIETPVCQYLRPDMPIPENKYQQNPQYIPYHKRTNEMGEEIQTGNTSFTTTTNSDSDSDKVAKINIYHFSINWHTNYHHRYSIFNHKKIENPEANHWIKNFNPNRKT